MEATVNGKAVWVLGRLNRGENGIFYFVEFEDGNQRWVSASVVKFV